MRDPQHAVAGLDYNMQWVSLPSLDHFRQREHAKIHAGYMHVAPQGVAGPYYDTKHTIYIRRQATASNPALFTKTIRVIDH